MVRQNILEVGAEGRGYAPRRDKKAEYEERTVSEIWCSEVDPWGLTSSNYIRASSVALFPENGAFSIWTYGMYFIFKPYQG